VRAERRLGTRRHPHRTADGIVPEQMACSPQETTSGARPEVPQAHHPGDRGQSDDESLTHLCRMPLEAQKPSLADRQTGGWDPR
jgi:hypothetical protein